MFQTAPRLGTNERKHTWRRSEMELMIATGSLIGGGALLGILGITTWWFRTARPVRAVATPPPDAGLRDAQVADLPHAA